MEGRGSVPLKVTLASRDNGVGLSVDMELLADLFAEAGHDVTKVDWRAPKIEPCDVLIFLELMSPHLMRYARKTIGIFNPEWFLPRWKVHAFRLDQIWAKSQSGLDAFSRINPRTNLTGFLGKDRFDPGVPRRKKALHVQGHSQDKNTERVIEAWTRNKDLPPLTIVGQAALRVPPWVRHYKRVPDAQMTALMNEHDIHVCPSKVEGWGHYITEALSVGAHVITVDASPMNEHVQPEWGTLVPPSAKSPRGITVAWDVAAGVLAEAVRRAALVEEAERARMRTAAQEHLRTRNTEFEMVALKLLEENA